MRTRPQTASFAVLSIALLIIAGGCASNDGPAKTTDKGQAFWPPFPDSPRIQFLTSFNSVTDVQQKSKLDDLLYGKENQSDLTINKPYGIKMFGSSVYVCDTQVGALMILDLQKKQVRVLGASGTGKLVKPVDIAVAPDGFKYVADTQKPAIYAFGADDKFVRFIGVKDFRPAAVAVLGDLLYCTDYKNHKILVWNRHTGEQVRSIGEVGKEPGQLANPLGIAVDKSGNIYVVEMMNCRIQKFSPDGKSLKVFGNRGTGVGTFTRPKHIAVDSEGIIYVADAAFQNVQMFNANFEPLMAFGGAGNFPGSMELPAGLAVFEGDFGPFKPMIHPAFDAKRLVLVTSQWGQHRVSVYAMGQLKPGKTMNDIAASKSVVPQDWATAASANTEKAKAIGPKQGTEVPTDMKDLPKGH